MSVNFPDDPPKPGDSHARHAAWVSQVTEHRIIGTWRPSRLENAGLLIRFESGDERYFESIAAANRPDRFFAAFQSIDGVVMSAYSTHQVRMIVGALVRMAKIGQEADALESYREIGSGFLLSCLSRFGTVPVKLDAENGEWKAAIAYLARIKFLLADDPIDRLPEVLHATDRRQLFVPRGPFLRYARPLLRGEGQTDGATVNANMLRTGWKLDNWRPRNRGRLNVEAYRPHLRLWQVAEGWEGIDAADAAKVRPEDVDEVSETVVPLPPGENADGPAWSHSLRGHARVSARASQYPGGTKGPKTASEGSSEGLRAPDEGHRLELEDESFTAFKGTA